MATVVSWSCQWRLTRAPARNFGFNGWPFRQLYYKRTHGHSGGAQAPTMAALSWPSRLVVASILSSHFKRVNASAHQTLNSQASSLRPSSSSHALTVALLSVILPLPAASSPVRRTRLGSAPASPLAIISLGTTQSTPTPHGLPARKRLPSTNFHRVHALT